MTPLKRWNEEDASAEELQLLAAARGETPGDDAYRKTLAVALGTSVAAPTSLLARWLANGTLKIFLGVAAVGVIGGAIALAYTATHQPARARETSHAPLVASAAPVIVDAPRVATTVETPEAVSVDSLPRVRAVPTSPAPPTPSSSSAPRESSLTRELATLDRAQRALAAKDTSGAMRTLDEYATEFPNGGMAPEATVLRVRVLLAQGRTDAARALTDSFAATHPSSPYTTQMLSLVSAKKE